MAGASDVFVPLKGRWPDERGDEPVVFHQRGAVLRLVDREKDPTRQLDLLEAPCAFETGTFEDRLVVAESSLSIPRGKGKVVEAAIAYARLASLRSYAVDVPACPFADEQSDLDKAWLARVLSADEPVLAWLITAEDVELASTYGPASKARVCVLRTPTRRELVSIGRLGDVRCVPLASSPPELISSRGRTRIRFTAAGDAPPEEPLLPLIPSRVLEALLALWTESAVTAALETARLAVERNKSGDAAFADALVDWVRRAAPEIDRKGQARAWGGLVSWVRGLPKAQEPDELVEWLGKLVASPEDGAKLAAWAVRWSVPEDGVAMLHRALWQAVGLDGEQRRRGALPMHALHLDNRRRELAKDPLLLAQEELELARRYADVGLVGEAKGELAALLDRLPAAELLDVVVGPPRVVDSPEPTSPTPAVLRAAVLDELEKIADGDLERRARLRELAELEPLSAPRVSRLLASLTDEPMHGRERVERVAALLPIGGIDDPAAAPSSLMPRSPLSPELVDGWLRHPRARDAGVIDRIQTLIASVEVPDYGALRDYCERLRPDRSEVADLVVEATVALGMPGVTVYVSRGDKGIGVRAYEGDPPFLLIGGEHLDAGGPYQLTSPELRFAVAAELAHLRLGHARITSQEVWRGAMDKGRDALDMVLGILPATRLAKLGDVLTAAIDRVPGAAVTKAWEKAQGWGLLGGEPSTDGTLAPGTEALIEAHRMMQLSADRAGLWVGGDLPAAIRAIFKLRPRYHAELPVARKLGLRDALARCDASGAPRHPDLAVRVGALVAFYLSEDFDRPSKASVRD